MPHSTVTSLQSPPTRQNAQPRSTSYESQVFIPRVQRAALIRASGISVICAITPGAIAASVLIATLPAAAVYRKPGAIQTYLLWRSPSSTRWVSYEPYSPQATNPYSARRLSKRREAITMMGIRLLSSTARMGAWYGRIHQATPGRLG